MKKCLHFSEGHERRCSIGPGRRLVTNQVSYRSPVKNLTFVCVQKTISNVTQYTFTDARMYFCKNTCEDLQRFPLNVAFVYYKEDFNISCNHKSLNVLAVIRLPAPLFCNQSESVKVDSPDTQKLLAHVFPLFTSLSIVLIGSWSDFLARVT